MYHEPIGKPRTTPIHTTRNQRSNPPLHYPYEKLINSPDKGYTGGSILHKTVKLDGPSTRIRSRKNIRGAIGLSRNPVYRQRCKHIDIKYYFIRDALHKGRINIIYCRTHDMLADIMTKPPTQAKKKKKKIQRTFIRTLAKPTNTVLSYIYTYKENNYTRVCGSVESSITPTTILLLL